MLPDKLQHQQLVEIGVEQRSRDRVQFPVVVMRPLREVHDHQAMSSIMRRPARNARPPSMRALQIVGRLVDAGRDVLDHLRNLRNLRFGFFPLLLVHVFADRGDRLGPVTGVSARRVNLVLEPGTLRKPLFVQEQPGTLSKSAFTSSSDCSERAGEPLACQSARALE